MYDGARYARRNQTSADDRSAISTESAESTEYVRYRKWYVVRGKSGVCKQYFTVMSKGWATVLGGSWDADGRCSL